MASAAKTSKTSSSSTANKNYSTSLANGGSVKVVNGVKTYSNKPLQVKGNNGISISGQSYSKDKGGSGFAPITAEKLAPSTPVVIPTPVQTIAPPVSASNAGISGAGTGITSTPTGLTVDPIVENSLATGRQNFNDMIASLNSADANRTTGADVQSKVIKDSHQKEYQRAVNDYTSQINNITASSQAQQLALEGQGRGQTSSFVGGEQARINREAAIQALPIQALLANAQGNLDTANQYINTWGKILMDDANNQYNHKVATIEAVYNFADGQEKTRLASLQAQAKEKKDAQIALASAKSKAMSQALSQPGGSSVIAAIQAATDENGVITALGKYNGDLLAQEAQRANIAQSYAATAASNRSNQPTDNIPTVKTINGTDMQWNPATQNWEQITSTGGNPKSAELVGYKALTDEIIASPYVKQVFGFKNPLTYWTPGSNEQLVKNQVSQLKGTLSLENRQKLKGSGAISDFESKVLSQSATALDTNLADKDAVKELKKISGVFATSSGLKATVKIIDPSTGQSQIIYADRDGINQALADGAVVEYQ